MSKKKTESTTTEQVSAPADAAPADAKKEDTVTRACGWQRPETPLAPADAKKEDTVTIEIHSQDGPGGKDDVVVVVNGCVWSIKRDHKVDVPRRVYNVLQDAVQTICVTDEHGVAHYVDRNRFAISTH